MNYTLSGEIQTNCAGWNKILDFYSSARKYPGSRIDLSFYNTKFFDANLSAVLIGAINDLKKNNGNYVFVDFKSIHSNCEVLARNGFTNMVAGNGTGAYDYKDSTVPVKYFYPSDADAYVNYVEKDFLKHRGLDGNVKADDLQRIKSHYLEIFDNVGLHAHSAEPVYSCGQYYPKQGLFKFTLVDLGVGFLHNVSRVDTSVQRHYDAITWAVKGNSTKTEASGGTGLKGILTYAFKQKAEFHIVSGDCYWLFNGRTIDTQKLKHSFKGVTIHLVFRH